MCVVSSLSAPACAAVNGLLPSFSHGSHSWACARTTSRHTPLERHLSAFALRKTTRIFTPLARSLSSLCLLQLRRGMNNASPLMHIFVALLHADQLIGLVVMYSWHMWSFRHATCTSGAMPVCRDTRLKRLPPTSPLLQPREIIVVLFGIRATCEVGTLEQ